MIPPETIVPIIANIFPNIILSSKDFDKTLLQRPNEVAKKHKSAKIKMNFQSAIDKVILKTKRALQMIIVAGIKEKYKQQ